MYNLPSPADFRAEQFAIIDKVDAGNPKLNLFLGGVGAVIGSMAGWDIAAQNMRRRSTKKESAQTK